MNLDNNLRINSRILLSDGKAFLCLETASGLPYREEGLIIPPSMTCRKKSCGLLNNELFCDLFFYLIRNGYYILAISRILNALYIFQCGWIIEGREYLLRDELYDPFRGHGLENCHKF